MQSDASTSNFQPPAQHLIPVIPLDTLRYNRSCSVHPRYQVINAGPVRHYGNDISPIFSWKRFVHPEGQPYFVLTGEFEFTIITATDIEVVQTERQIIEYARLASKEIRRNGIELPLESELILELADDYTSCNYYFVHHAAKTLFWLTDVDTELLGMPPAVSISHLDPILQGYYWVYVEYFPMHHKSRQKEHAQFVEDLYNIISHGQADRLTSRTSTFPYSAGVCEQFLKLLFRKKGQPIDGYTLCYVARITGAIMNQRFTTHYGQEFAQLDRQQYSIHSFEHQRLWTAANLLMWRIPQYYNNLLEDLYANGSVSDQWLHFLSLCQANWMGSLLWSLSVLIASILPAVVEDNISVANPPALFSIMCIFSASFLHLWHYSYTEASPSDAIYYIRQAKSSTTGFLLLSFMFSLPQASYLWSVLLLIVQFLLIVYHSGSKLVVVTITSVFVFVFALMWRVVFSGEATPLSLFRTFAGLFVPPLYLVDLGGEISMA